MTIIETTTSFNPRNPKCVYCKDYPFKEGEWLSATCQNKIFKGTKHRYHNSKACVQFQRRKDQ